MNRMRLRPHSSYSLQLLPTRPRVTLICAIVLASCYTACVPHRHPTLSSATSDPTLLVLPDEAAKVLRNAPVQLYKRADVDQGSLSLRYETQSYNAVTANVFFKSGKEFFDLQTIGKDDPAHYGKWEPCQGIGDSCYRPNLLLVVVLKGDVCFTIKVEPVRDLSSVDLAARDDLARSIARRL